MLHKSLLRKLLVGLALGTSLAVLSSINLKSQAQFVQIPCSNLRGAGTFSNPLVIGMVTRPIVIVNCPALSSGRGFTVRYFSFSLRSRGSQGSYAGTGATITAQVPSAVHPRIATQSGFTLLTSFSPSASWIGNPNQPGPLWRLLPLNGLSAGSYVLGAEKLDPPFRSIQTPNFSIAINP